MRGKEVYIRQKLSFAEEARQDPEVKAYFGMGKKSIGSYFREFGRTVESGLNQHEEKELLPIVTAIYPDDKREFNKSVQHHYKNLNTSIPREGIKLQIGLEDPTLPLVYWTGPDGEISTTIKSGFKPALNKPIKVDDYMRYRHAIKHPQVGANLNEADRYEHVKFYIDDPSKTTAIAIKINSKEDEASLIYHNNKKNEDKVTQILTLLGITTRGKSKEEKVLLFKDQVTANESLPEQSQLSALENFVTIATDKKLEKKYEIEEFIRTKILERHGSRILNADGGEEIGATIEDAVGWLSSPENSKDYNIFKAKYKELNKK